MKNLLLSQLLALCLVLVYQVMSGAAQADHSRVTDIIPHYDQRNFNFGGMYSTVVKYVVRAVNFTYNLINSPPVCHLLNNCKENEVNAPVPLRPSGYESNPYSVEENLVSHDTYHNSEYTGPLIDALLATNVDNVKAHEDEAKDTSEPHVEAATS